MGEGWVPPTERSCDRYANYDARPSAFASIAIIIT